MTYYKNTTVLWAWLPIDIVATEISVVAAVSLNKEYEHNNP
jgi:hypothetical protein